MRQDGIDELEVTDFKHLSFPQDTIADPTIAFPDPIRRKSARITGRIACLRAEP